MNADDFTNPDSGSNDRKYNRFTKSEFEEFLGEHWGNYIGGKIDSNEIENYLSFSTEYVYRIPIENSFNGRLSIVIFSTVDHRTDKARDKGQDAIRTVLWDSKTQSIIGGRTKTLRIKTWKKNLKSKIDSLYNDTESYTNECDECYGFMVERESQYGKFLGCTNYPDCKNTMQLHANK